MNNTMKRRYKRFLYTNEKIPRSTLYYRRRRQAEKQRTLQNTPEESSRDVINPSTEDNVEESGSLPLVVQPNNCVSKETDNPGVLDSYQKISPEKYDSTLDIPSSPTVDPQQSDSSLIDDSVSSSSSESSSASTSSHEECVTHNAPTDPSDQRARTTPLSERLCDCTNTTVTDVIFMCLVLGVRHNLTWEAQLDIFRMVNSIYDKETIPETKYKYFKFIEKEKESIAYHIYCPKCEVYLGEESCLQDSVNCTFCADDINLSKSPSIFVSISLESQMQKIVKDPSIASSMLSHRFNRRKERPHAFEDIYDGQQYKKHCCLGGILSNPFNFSFSFNTDGVPTGKSTGKSMWPTYVTINELPYRDRSRYMLLAGLYVGPKDPNQMVFLQPFVKELNKLSSQGFSWAHDGKDVVSKVIPFCAVTDSVARWQLLNMQSFHAYYGCTFCYEKQEKTGPRSRCFNFLSEKVNDRTAESTYEDAMAAFERKDEPRIDKRHYKGVKGPSILMDLLYFDLIWGFVVDSMHAILLGVVKTHMEYLFDSTKKNVG